MRKPDGCHKLLDGMFELISDNSSFIFTFEGLNIGSNAKAGFVYELESLTVFV
jgi:hypothetical protein